MLPELKSLFLESFGQGRTDRPMKSRQFTYKDMQSMFNLQSLFVNKKSQDELTGETQVNADGEDDSDEYVAVISHEKFPLTIEYYYGYGGSIGEEEDEIVIKDKDGSVLETIPNNDGRFPLVKRQLYKFFHHDDG